MAENIKALLTEARVLVGEVENSSLFLLDNLPDNAPPEGVAELMETIENIKYTLQMLEEAIKNEIY